MMIWVKKKMVAKGPAVLVIEKEDRDFRFNGVFGRKSDWKLQKYCLQVMVNK